MAAPVLMTASDAIREVLARCDLLDDDVVNPALETATVLHLNAAQRQLQREHDWLIQTRHARVIIEAGANAVAIPDSAAYGAVTGAAWDDGSGLAPVLLTGGIPIDAEDATGIPEHYDLRVGDDGDTVLMLWPQPEGGSVAITYQAGAVPLVDTDDRLSLDEEAVIGRAAWLLASAKGMGQASALLATHNNYLASIKTKQRPGRTFSMRRTTL